MTNLQIGISPHRVGGYERVTGEKLVGALGCSVVDGDGGTVLCDVQCKVPTHDGEADESEGGVLGHGTTVVVKWGAVHRRARYRTTG